ncbi:class I adenylate-forming enzyme family protein [Streptomyces viridiviolaceus]|uniref:Class I adenylate-forming enzyme family protein n=1 Tax=Streptomyces viridiviolaceus TaxID=68282 RepID=A0ABW2E804_9ACTN|nr:class I adenylate-forming enzyme family protein [Streptomyces viridiviolaceus]
MTDGINVAQTFAELWRESVTAHSESTFLLFQEEDGHTAQWTYAEFDRVVAGTAAFLKSRGVRRNDAIHVCLRNCPAFIALWLAASRIGAWIVPVDPASTVRDISNQISRVRPAIGICAEARRDVYADGAGGDVEFVALRETHADLDDSPLLAVGTTPSAQVTPAATDRLAVMFTSGTTSQPKGVVLTQRNYAHVAQVMSACVGLQPHHRWLVTLPLFHANAQYYCFAPAIAVGASVALTARFSASQWVRQARDLSATHASLFAAPIRMILARTAPDTEPVSLQHVWFAQSLGAEHHRAFSELAGCHPRQLYGMTETVSIVTADDSEPPTYDLIGRAVEGRRVRLIDPVTEDDVAPGEIGMIAVAGTRGGDLFSEYLDDPITTGRSFITIDAQLWFKTGDLAVATPSGALRFVGRADDVIKVAGENVSLTEIEATVSQAPGVLEAAVVSRPDPIRDQVPVAYVVPRRKDEPPALDALVSWAERQLPPQARPREWHFIDELPRTSVGKIRRFAIPTTP